MESSGDRSEKVKPDPAWKWLVMLFGAGLVSAASPDIWLMIKTAVKRLVEAGWP
jgi:hypothetical protein